MSAEVLWPDRLSLYELMRHRASIGHAAFEAEHQGNPVDPSTCEWPEEIFNWPGIHFDAWPEKLDLRVVSIDPSKGRDSKHGDFSAIILYGRASASGIEYVECDMSRRPVDVICQDAARLCKGFGPDVLALETNGFQELMKVPLEDELRKAGVEVWIRGMDNSVNKNVRIRRLTSPLTTKRMRFKSRSPGTYKLLEQLKLFPNADNDDGPDGVEMARRAAIELASGKATPRR